MLERLRKIERLAKEGARGERQAAASKLQELLRKHGLTLEDLEATAGPKREKVFFTYKTRHERTLLFQIWAKVTDSGGAFTYWKPKNRHGVYLKVSEKEAERIEELFGVYREKLREEIEIVVDAFIQTNELYPHTNGSNGDVDIDFEYLRKMAHMMASMEKVSLPVHRDRQLTGGE